MSGSGYASAFVEAKHEEHAADGTTVAVKESNGRRLLMWQTYRKAVNSTSTICWWMPSIGKLHGTGPL